MYDRPSAGMCTHDVWWSTLKPDTNEIARSFDILPGALYRDNTHIIALREFDCCRWQPAAIFL